MITNRLKILLVFLWCILLLSVGIYFSGFGFETKYFVTSLDTGQYGWIKKRGGFSYQSTYTYNTYKKAQEAAKSHRQYSANDKIIKKIPLALD